MPKRKPDLNEIAAHIVEATARMGAELPKIEGAKNPAAVALGRLGGLKGGKARARKLSSDRRKAIARNAAKRRWANHPK